jgi:uncharacterized iron-regulated membrane protein
VGVTVLVLALGALFPLTGLTILLMLVLDQLWLAIARWRTVPQASREAATMR